MSADESGVGLDPEWIAARCGEHFGGSATAKMAGFIGTGQMSRNARFRLAWTEGTGPDSVVVKIPSADPGTREISFEHDVYAKECTFYSSIAPIVDITTPGVIYVHMDAAGHDFGLILEDMAGSEQGDQFREATSDELRLAIEQAAALHAPVWDRMSEPVFAPFVEQQRGTRAVEMMPFLMAVVRERLAEGLEPDVLKMLETFEASVPVWSVARAEPQTLVHGDFRPDNFMIGVDTDAPPIAIVDWQTLAAGKGVTDVAYLLAGAVEPERRRAIEGEMVEYYRAQLAERGIDYSAEDCDADYALGAIHGIGVGVTATALAERTERGDALFTQMINRHGRHALDLDAFTRLNSQGV